MQGKMPDITESLNAVADEPIGNLFKFVEAWYTVSEEKGNVIDQFMAERTILEVGEAIHLYAQWKEMQKCQE